MSLSASQLKAISVTERVCSAVSLIGTSIIIVSFLSSRSFRKPINRLVFYACFGNIMASVATMISQDSIHAGTASNLCQLQAFLIQWFMPADALWTFAMAFNVHLTFFHKYSPEQLRRQEWKYVVLCYGIPFIPAFVYFFIKSRARGQIYGSAILWCWVAPAWDILRIAVFYGPVWFVIISTLAIYIRIGNLIWRRRRQLREAGGVTTINVSESDTSPYEPSLSKVTEIHVAREPVPPPPTIINHQHQQQQDAYYLQSPTYIPYSVAVEGGGNLSQRDPADVVALEPIRTIDVSEVDGPSSSQLDPEVSRNQSYDSPSEVNSATWAYTKYAMLFFVALFVTWVPSTINRVYAFIFPDNLNFALNYASSFVLPLQGFWNSLIYVSISLPSFKLAYARYREGTLDIKPPNFHHFTPHRASSGGVTSRRASSGEDSTRRLTN